jgi:hypothetical protein
MMTPILSAQFFDHYAPDLGFFSKWRNLFPWHDQIMPIYEWQGVLYVGCTELPRAWSNKNQKVVFVFCDPEALKRVWYNFEGTVVHSRRAPIAEEPTPVSSKLKPQIPGVQPYGAQINEAPQEVVRSAPSEFNFAVPFEAPLEAPAEKALEAPHILELPQEDAPLSLELSSPQIPIIPESAISAETAPSESRDSSLQSAEELPELTLSYQSPESIQLDSAIPDAPAQKPTPELDLEMTQPMILEVAAVDGGENAEVIAKTETHEPTPQTPEASPILADQKTSEEKVSKEEKASKIVPTSQPQSASLDPMEALMAASGITLDSADEKNNEENPSSETSPAEEEEKLELLELGGSPPPASLNSKEEVFSLQPLASTDKVETLAISVELSPAAPQTTTKEPSGPAAAKSQIKSAIKNPSLEPWVEKAFREIKLEYQKVMILLKQGDQLKPWRWDEDFVASQPVNNPFSMVSPSPFRIVQRTQKSYHGYVVENDHNRKFFEQWNQGQKPDILTVVPILNQSNLIGVLLAIGAATADTKGCLQLMEDKGQELASHVLLASNAA